MKPTTNTTYTVHGVLAGAYRGRNVSTRSLLTHASVDGAESSLCKRARNLCDAEEAGEVDCPECLARIARRGLVRA
jgi:hypothetical protein